MKSIVAVLAAVGCVLAADKTAAPKKLSTRQAVKQSSETALPRAHPAVFQPYASDDTLTVYSSEYGGKSVSPSTRPTVQAESRSYFQGSKSDGPQSRGYSAPSYVQGSPSYSNYRYGQVNNNQRGNTGYQYGSTGKQRVSSTFVAQPIHVTYGNYGQAAQSGKFTPAQGPQYNYVPTGSEFRRTTGQSSFSDPQNSKGSPSPGIYSKTQVKGADTPSNPDSTDANNSSPSYSEKYAAILMQQGAVNHDGTFNYGFQSDNGIQSNVVGSVKNISPEEQAQVVQGSYYYVAPDGTPIYMEYYADETGFHVVEGAHLPTPPPIPEAIARSLETLPTLEEFEEQERLRQEERRAAAKLKRTTKVKRRRNAPIEN